MSWGVRNKDPLKWRGHGGVLADNLWVHTFALTSLHTQFFTLLESTETTSIKVWLLRRYLDKNLQVSLSMIFPVSLPLLSRAETNCSSVNTGYLQTSLLLQYLWSLEQKKVSKIITSPCLLPHRLKICKTTFISSISDRAKKKKLVSNYFWSWL